jgi:hypothetical protein
MAADMMLYTIDRMLFYALDKRVITCCPFVLIVVVKVFGSGLKFPRATKWSSSLGFGPMLQPQRFYWQVSKFTRPL